MCLWIVILDIYLKQYLPVLCWLARVRVFFVHMFAFISPLLFATVKVVCLKVVEMRWDGIFDPQMHTLPLMIFVNLIISGLHMRSSETDDSWKPLSG